MSILTPDTGYGFPAVGYIQNQIGHTAIILGVSYAMVIDNQRPYLKDVARALGFATILVVCNVWSELSTRTSCKLLVYS